MALEQILGAPKSFLRAMVGSTARTLSYKPKSLQEARREAIVPKITRSLVGAGFFTLMVACGNPVSSPEADTGRDAYEVGVNESDAGEGCYIEPVASADGVTNQSICPDAGCYFVVPDSQPTGVQSTGRVQVCPEEYCSFDNLDQLRRGDFTRSEALRLQVMNCNPGDGELDVGYDFDESEQVDLDAYDLRQDTDLYQDHRVDGDTMDLRLDLVEVGDVEYDSHNFDGGFGDPDLFADLDVYHDAELGDSGNTRDQDANDSGEFPDADLRDLSDRGDGIFYDVDLIDATDVFDADVLRDLTDAVDYDSHNFDGDLRNTDLFDGSDSSDAYFDMEVGGDLIDVSDWYDGGNEPEIILYEYLPDNDNDGFPESEETQLLSGPVAPYRLLQSEAPRDSLGRLRLDCNGFEREINPGADDGNLEDRTSLDGIDNNCNGLVDDGTIVYISGGLLSMGCNPGIESCPSDEPQHQVFLNPYLIDGYEVTVVQLGECIRDRGPSGEAAPACRETESIGLWDPGSYLLPATNLTLGDMDRICDWKAGGIGQSAEIELSDGTFVEIEGFRPTEYEWEFATEGPTDRIYPMPGVLTPVLANVEGDGIVAVGSHLGSNSLFGLRDTMGNVGEATGFYSPDYGGTATSPETDVDPLGPESGSLIVVRGGNWTSYSDQISVADRSTSVPPGSLENDLVGVRCAYRIQESSSE